MFRAEAQPCFRVSNNRADRLCLPLEVKAALQAFLIIVQERQTPYKENLILESTLEVAKYLGALSMFKDIPI